MLLQLRAKNATYSPNKWGFFGGRSELNETPEQTLFREIKEETGIEIQSDNTELINEYKINYDLYRYVFLIKDFPKNILLNEGQKFNWVSIDKVLGYDLTDRARIDVDRFIYALRNPEK